MSLLLAALYYLVSPYWDTQKRALLADGFSTLTVIHGPNLIGHPIGIIALFVLGLWQLPTDWLFYGYWAGMIALSSISLVLSLWGLMQTTFFGAQVLGQLGFVASSAAAVLLLGETLTPLKYAGIAFAIVGVALFSTEVETGKDHARFDRGVLLILASLAIDAVADVGYKVATTHADSYASFLTGRFVGDAVGWTIVWLVGFLAIRRDPIAELIRGVRHRAGGQLFIGLAVWTALSSWLIYTLPLTTFVLFSTLTVPVAYAWSHLRYRDAISARMYAGAACIIGAVVAFVMG